MKKTPLVATKLAEGTPMAPAIVSPVTLWWPKHAGCVLTYALNDALGDGTELKRERDALLYGGTDWEDLVPQAARRRKGASTGLMREHTELEIALVEATILADSDRMEEVTRALELNAEAHRARYARVTRRFPENTFADLMRSHVHLLVQIMRGTLQGETPEKNSKLFVTNSVRLGSLMTEWFPLLRGVSEPT